MYQWLGLILVNVVIDGLMRLLEGDEERRPAREPKPSKPIRQDVWSGGYRDKDGVWHDFERPK